MTLTVSHDENKMVGNGKWIKSSTFYNENITDKIGSQVGVKTIQYSVLLKEHRLQASKGTKAQTLASHLKSRRIKL